jgi:hypothetical protein
MPGACGLPEADGRRRGRGDGRGAGSDGCDPECVGAAAAASLCRDAVGSDACVRSPQPEEAVTVPTRAGDRLGDLRQARVALPVPGEALLQHHHPLRRAVPLANQQRSRLQTDAVSRRWIAPREETDVGTVAVAALRLPNHPQQRPVEIPQRRDLHALRENPRQQPARQMGGRGPAQMVAPLQPELIGAEIGESRDEDVERRSRARRWRRSRFRLAGVDLMSSSRRHAAGPAAASAFCSGFVARAAFFDRATGAVGGSIAGTPSFPSARLRSSDML